MSTPRICLRRYQEPAIKTLLLILASVSILAVVAVFGFLVGEGLPLFKVVTVREFLLGKFWYPTADPPDYGILPMIVGSLVVSLSASVLAIPLGLAAAVYVAELAGPKLAEIVKPLLELAAAIPSVVIGFFGMVIVAPVMQLVFDIPNGLNIVNAALMLGLMAVPTIASLSEDALRAVPRSLREASYALGANQWETISSVVVPAAFSGIGKAIILGIARAIGETMVVLMVAGGAAAFPESLFDSCRPLPASIAAEMAEAPHGSTHYHALFAVGIVLLGITFIFNLAASYVSRTFRFRSE